MLCTGATFVKKSSWLFARIVSFANVGLQLLTFLILEPLSTKYILTLMVLWYYYSTIWISTSKFPAAKIWRSQRGFLKPCQNFRVRLKFNICQAMKIKFFVAREIQYFWTQKFFFYLANLCFIVSTRAFNLLSRAFSVPTRAFNPATRAFSFLTRGFELVTRDFKLVTRGFELVTHNS